jgi:hypothetical protein
MAEMNAAQVKAFLRYVAEARDVFDIELRHTKASDGVNLPFSSITHDWLISYEDESRPGRGHSVSALHVDGEHIVHITLDVYGYGALGVGEIAWTHSSTDSECECEPNLIGDGTKEDLHG